MWDASLHQGLNVLPVGKLSGLTKSDYIQRARVASRLLR